MSEEIKNPGTEMNEATLEGASGGFAISQDPYDRAQEICCDCLINRSAAKCSGGPVHLGKYQEEHGNIASYTSCPFRG